MIKTFCDHCGAVIEGNKFFAIDPIFKYGNGNKFFAIDPIFKYGKHIDACDICAVEFSNILKEFLNGKEKEA